MSLWSQHYLEHLSFEGPVIIAHIMSSGSTDGADIQPRVHPVVRNALRISLSAKEYKTLHQLVSQRAPSFQSRLPSPSKYEAIVRSKNRHNEAAFRTSVRVFLVSGALLKLVDRVARRIRGELARYDTMLADQNFPG